MLLSDILLYISPVFYVLGAGLFLRVSMNPSKDANDDTITMRVSVFFMASATSLVLASMLVASDGY